MTLTVLGVLIKYFWRFSWDLFGDFLLVRVELSVSGEKTIEVKCCVKSICYQHDLWPLMLPLGTWLRFARFLHWKILLFPSTLCSGLPRWLSGKEPTCQHRRHRDVGSIPGWGRSPGGGNGNPLQYSCLENFMDRRAWWATVCGVTVGLTWLSPHASPFERKSEECMLRGWGDILHFLEEEGYLHKLYEVFAWKIYLSSSMYVFIWSHERLCLPLFWFWPQCTWQLFPLL